MNNESYTPSFGYKILEGNTSNAPLWSWIWKLQVPPNNKMFLWHAHYNALPTLKQGKYLGMTSANGAIMALRIWNIYYGHAPELNLAEKSCSTGSI